MAKPSTAGAIALAGCALAIGLAGCGNNDKPGGVGGTPASPPSAPASPSLSVPATPSMDSASSTAKLPAGFPLPAKTKKTVTGSNKQITAQLEVKNGGDAYDFWLKQLPKNGYNVTAKKNVDIGGTKATIGFHGHGYSTGRIVITDTTAALVLKK